MELVLQDFVGLGQTNHPLNVYSLGGNDPIPDHSLCWQLVDPSHGGWCINLNVVRGEQILNLKEARRKFVVNKGLSPMLLVMLIFIIYHDSSVGHDRVALFKLSIFEQLRSLDYLAVAGRASICR